MIDLPNLIQLVTIEIVAYNIESALRAQEGGADRIELCADPGAGGTSPSYGVVEVVRQNISIDLFAMIRPRGGDFVYSNYEFHAMKRDLAQFQRLSVDGVVFGIVTPDGKLDSKRCRELIERARPLKVTCHRAFDRTRDPLEALEDCIEAGFDRILTSGHKHKAFEGIPLIRSLIEKAGNRITIMPGSGINTDNAGQIIRETGAREIHFSASKYRESMMKFTGSEKFPMGLDDASESLVRTVDVDVVRSIRAIADQLS